MDKDIRTELAVINAKLDALSTKVDALSQCVRERHNELRDRIKATDGRVWGLVLLWLVHLVGLVGAVLLRV